MEYLIDYLGFIDGSVVLTQCFFVHFNTLTKLYFIIRCQRNACWTLRNMMRSHEVTLLIQWGKKWHQNRGKVDMWSCCVRAGWSYKECESTVLWALNVLNSHITATVAGSDWRGSETVREENDKGWRAVMAWWIDVVFVCIGVCANILVESGMEM